MANEASFQSDSHCVPAWLKVGYAIGTPIVGGVYWWQYGPRNFLWLSDLALASTALSVTTGNRLLASMPAVGVLPLELAWNADFLSGGRLIGLANYMFDRRLPLGLRALSLFHVALPPTLLWMMRRFGYDSRALPAQTALTWAALSASYALSRPEDNINWVFGPGGKPQRAIHPLLYFGLEMIVLPVAVFLPMHFLLKRFFPQGKWLVKRVHLASLSRNFHRNHRRRPQLVRNRLEPRSGQATEMHR